MRLPRFLEFLRPRLDPGGIAAEGLRIRGHLRVERQVRGGPRELVSDHKNFIVNVGVTAVRDILIGPNGGGFTGSIFRMAIGDGGTPSGELFNPRPPDPTWPARTGLFHEVLRQDISVFETPTATTMRFTGSFNSVGVDNSSFSVSVVEGGVVHRVINEAALIIGNGTLTTGGGRKQINKVPPEPADSDEIVLSVRTHNSTPFDPSEDVTITSLWTIEVASS